MLFDVHTHLHDPRCAPFLGPWLEEMDAAGIAAFAVCGTGDADWDAVACLTAAHPQAVPAFGVHPWRIAAQPADWLERLEERLRRHPEAAVGEVGLDAVRRSPDTATQQAVLERQLQLAVRLHRPVCLHAARCVPAVLAAVRPHARRLPGFLIHGFSGGPGELHALETLGGYAAFGGALRNPRAVRSMAAARRIAPERLLIETDAPDMLPVDGRSCGGDARLNHPVNLVSIAAALAARRGLDTAALGAVTTRNARNFFGMSGAPARAEPCA